MQSPEVFGMHDNVSISKELQETRHMIDNVLLAQGRLMGAGTRGTGSHTDERLADISANILDKVHVAADSPYHKLLPVLPLIQVTSFTGWAKNMLFFVVMLLLKCVATDVVLFSIVAFKTLDISQDSVATH